MLNDESGSKKNSKLRKDSAEEDLRKNYRDLVESLNSIILRWKPTGEITFFNKYAQSFFGYSEDEILGKNVMILTPQRDSLGNDLTNLAENILKSPEKYVTNENENVRRNGERMRMPRKPSTTEGSPPSNSTRGLRISRSQRGATSDIKTAVPIPKGRATTMAPRVMMTEPVISGRMPK